VLPDRRPPPAGSAARLQGRGPGTGPEAFLRVPETVSRPAPGFQRYITTGVPGQPPKGWGATM
jgi:hypothetical protein